MEHFSLRPWGHKTSHLLARLERWLRSKLKISFLQAFQNSVLFAMLRLQRCCESVCSTSNLRTSSCVWRVLRCMSCRIATWSRTSFSSGENCWRFWMWACPRREGTKGTFGGCGIPDPPIFWIRDAVCIHPQQLLIALLWFPHVFAPKTPQGCLLGDGQ